MNKNEYKNNKIKIINKKNIKKYDRMNECMNE